MLRRFSLVLTLAAWFVATGSQWELVQAFGWGRMIVTYSRSMSVTQAVQKTFSGDDLCGVCKMVQGAKQSDDANSAKVPGPKAPEKIFVVAKSLVPVFGPPSCQCAGVIPGVTPLVSAEQSAPPGPPPRLAA